MDGDLTGAPAVAQSVQPAAEGATGATDVGAGVGNIGAGENVFGDMSSRWDAYEVPGEQTAEPALDPNPAPAPDPNAPVVDPNAAPDASAEAAPADPNAPLDIDQITALDQLREHAKGLDRDLRAAKPLLDAVKGMSPEIVKKGADFRMNWHAPVPEVIPGDAASEAAVIAAIAPLYNELLDSNPGKLQAFLWASAKGNADYLSQVLYGQSAAAVKEALARPAPDPNAAAEGGDDVVDPSYTADPNDPRERELSELREYKKNEEAAKQTERQEQAQLATKELRDAAHGSFNAGLDTAIDPIMEALDWGEENKDLFATVIEQSKADLRRNPELKPYFDIVEAAVKAGNKTAIAEVLPVFQVATHDALRARVDRMSRLVAAERELAEVKRQKVGSEVRLAGDGGPAVPTGSDSPGATGNGREVLRQGNAFENLGVAWSQY